MRTSGKAGLFIVILSCMLSCTEPISSDSFQKNFDRDAMGWFSFIVDMSDSLSTYDLSFYTLAEGQLTEVKNLPDIPLEIRMYSPTGECYEETVSIPASSFLKKGSFRKYCKTGYRKDCIPAVNGVWNVKVNIPLTTFPSIRGLGLICTRDYGKR